MNTPLHYVRTVQVLRNTNPNSTPGISAKVDHLAVVGTVDDEGHAVTPLPREDCYGQVDANYVPLFAITTTPVFLRGGPEAVPLIPVTVDPTTKAYTRAPGVWEEGGNWAIGDLTLANTIVSTLGTSPLYTGTEILMPVWDHDMFDRT